MISLKKGKSGVGKTRSLESKSEITVEKGSSKFIIKFEEIKKESGVNGMIMTCGYERIGKATVFEKGAKVCKYEHTYGSNSHRYSFMKDGERVKSGMGMGDGFKDFVKKDVEK